MTTVLVTDAGYKHTLGAIRNLSDHGCRVVAAAPRGHSRIVRGFASRHTHARVLYPPPEDGRTEFVFALAELAEHHRVDVVLPISDAAVVAVSQHLAELLPHVAVPVTAWEAGMHVAADKQETLELAAAEGVPIPRTFRTVDEIDAYPVVVKPRTGSGLVRYARDESEARRMFVPGDLCEEYVAGDGYAYFGLYDHGEERAFFMHRRIREYPPSGGPSTAAESFVDPVLHDLGARLLRALAWHGVAMVEFKRDRRDGAYKLMEINPKFWGSLDLAIAAGVEFPWLATQLALGEPLGDPPAYQDGLRFQWVFEDLLHVVARPASAPAYMRDLFSRRVRHDVRRDDLRPLAAAAGSTAAAIGRRLGRHPTR